MFTVEMDFDDIEIYVLDESGNHEDVVVNAFDDIVFIRQWDDDKGCHDIISMSPKMWEKFITAIHSPSGSYLTR